MRYINLLIAFCVIGIVDQVHGELVGVELTGSDKVLSTTHLPLWMFPCEISEGDIFYFTKENGLLELRCGEPPPG